MHRAECELWEKMALGAAEKGVSTKGELDHADRACAQAVGASSMDAQARVQRALVMSARVYAMKGDTSEEATRIGEEAVRAAEEAVRVTGGDVMAHYSHARALYLRAALLDTQGREASIEPAITAFREVIELDPNFTWAVNELGLAHMTAAKIADKHGREVQKDVDAAIAQFDRAIALDPAFASPAHEKVQALAWLLRHEINANRAENAPVVKALDALAELDKRTDVNPWRRAYWKIRIYRLLARREHILNRDPGPSCQKAFDTANAFAEDQPQEAFIASEVAYCHFLLAHSAIDRALDPQSELEAARTAVQVSEKARGKMTADIRELCANIELAAIRAAKRPEDVKQETWNAALEWIRPFLDGEMKNPSVYKVAARIYAQRALWAQRLGKDNEKDVILGFAMVDKTLAKDPKMSEALLAKGLLYLTRALAAKRGNGRIDFARQAREALESAFREDPMLVREHNNDLQEAIGLL